MCICLRSMPRNQNFNGDRDDSSTMKFCRIRRNPDCMNTGHTWLLCQANELICIEDSQWSRDLHRDVHAKVKYVESCWNMLSFRCDLSHENHRRFVLRVPSHLAKLFDVMNIRNEPSGAKCLEDGTNPQKNVGQVMLGSLFGWKRLPLPSTESSEKMFRESSCWHCLPSKSKNSGHAAASDWQRSRHAVISES